MPDVAVDLAACVLATCGAVRGDLAAQRPRVGHIAEQAGATFAGHAGQWSAMVRPAARAAVQLAGGIGDHVREALADSYAEDLARSVNTAAAEGLAEAMDMQTTRDVHPDVAWQRAVAGYGLPKKPMRSFISAALRTPTKDGGIAKAAAPHGDVLANAGRALLAYAEKIGECEAKAWSTLQLPEPIAKAFDRSQRRDDDGRWTEGGAARGRPAGNVKVRERRADEVDELLAGATAPAPAQQNTYAPANSYAGTNTYAPVNSYAPAENTYGAQANSYGEANEYAPKGRGRGVVRAYYLIGAKKPSDEVRAEHTSGRGVYVPMERVAGFYFDGRDESEGAIVDFSHIAAFQGAMPAGLHGPVEASEYDSAWSASGGFGVDMSADDWSLLQRHAKPLFDEVMSDPVGYAGKLWPEQIAEVFKRAGYPFASNTANQKELERMVKMRDMGVSRTQTPKGDIVNYDEGLLEAVADFLVWHEPEKLGEMGNEFGDLLDLYADRSTIDNTPVPGVIAFSSGAVDGEDLADLRGRYVIDRTEYHSALSEFGGHGAPIGKMALRELHVKPIQYD